jgi:hypothetical protein
MQIANGLHRIGSDTVNSYLVVDGGRHNHRRWAAPLLEAEWRRTPTMSGLSIMAWHRPGGTESPALALLALG